MATHLTPVNYITDSTTAQALKISRNGINYAIEYPALIQNILIQGVSSDLLSFSIQLHFCGTYLPIV